jgi:hypothetical protein
MKTAVFTFDSYMTRRREELDDLSRRRENQTKAEATRKEITCDVLRSYIVDALYRETRVGLGDLAYLVDRVDYQDQSWNYTRRFTVDGQKIILPQTARAHMAYAGVPFHADFELIQEFADHNETIIYTRTGNYSLEGLDTDPWPAFSRLDDALLCIEAHVRERKAAAQKNDHTQERDAVLAELDKNPQAVYLLMAFMASQRQVEMYETRIDELTDELDNTNEALDRCAELAAATQGDLLDDLDEKARALEYERAAGLRLERKLDEAERELHKVRQGG